MLLLVLALAWLGGRVGACVGVFGAVGARVGELVVLVELPTGEGVVLVVDEDVEEGKVVVDDDDTGLAVGAGVVVLVDVDDDVDDEVAAVVLVDELGTVGAAVVGEAVVGDKVGDWEGAKVGE